MACGCKQKHLLTPDSRGIARANPAPDDSGVIQLADYPDCTTPYRGRWKSATVYILGWGTAAETLYRRSERNEAIAAARAQHASLDPVHAGALCDQAVTDLLGE